MKVLSSRKNVDSSHYRLLILLFEIDLCLLDRKRFMAELRRLACLLLTPLCTRALHNLKEDGRNALRIRLITSDSDNPNWKVMASKGVRSSQAISITRSKSLSVIIFNDVHIWGLQSLVTVLAIYLLIANLDLPACTITSGQIPSSSAPLFYQNHYKK